MHLPFSITQYLLFVLSAVHLAEALWFKMWWLIPTAVLAGVGEVIGWVGRFWSSQNVLDMDPFLMQYVIMDTVGAYNLN